MVSHAAEPSTVPDNDLAPTQTVGYVIGQKKTLDEYAEIDKEDESLNKWKASLGLGAGASSGKPQVTMSSLSLVAASRPQPIVLDLTKPDELAALAKAPVTIKEGAEYAVELKFSISGAIVTGLRYIQVVRRAGINVDKLESMIGSYGPAEEAYIKRFVTEEAPSGMIARSGTYTVRSRIIDDDGTTYADFAWQFKLAKEW